MLISKHQYRDNILGFSVVDCVVRSRDIFYFVARQNGTAAHPAMSEHLAKKRIIAFMRDQPDATRWSHAELEGMDRIFAASCMMPAEQFVGVDAEGAVYLLGGGESRMGTPLRSGPEGPIRGAVCKARQIAGHVHVVSGRRGLCRRTGSDTWTSLCPPFSLEPKSTREEYELTRGWGFRDVDGFALDDLYAVGGAGDAWHYDGRAWHQLSLRTNILFESVCCGADGTVYIGAQSGTLIAGKGPSWRVLQENLLSLPHRDLVWHEAELYGGNDYGLWKLTAAGMVKVDLPDEIQVCCGNLSAHDGILLMAGVHGAAFMSGGVWHPIFNTFNEIVSDWE